jgi:hypothetical protein
MGDVVARHHGEGRSATVAAALQGHDQRAEHALRPVGMGGIVADVRMLGIEGSGRGIDAIAALGHGQRHDAQGCVVERIDDGGGVLAHRDETGHAARHSGGIRAGLQPHHGGEPVLRLKSAAHGLIARTDAGPEQRPIEIPAPVEQVVEIDRLMGTVEIADADVQDAGAQGIAGVVRP